jgi:tetratricopeptide (TPR) repeat protein
MVRGSRHLAGGQDASRLAASESASARTSQDLGGLPPRSPGSPLARVDSSGLELPKTSGSAAGIISREESGDRILRRAEGALARTKLSVLEWSQALFDAKTHLVAAKKEYGGGPAQLLQDKKPSLADLARRIKVVENQITQQLVDDTDRHEEMIEAGDYSTFIASMEHGWWLREELYGKDTAQVHEHVQELVLMLNNIAMHLVNKMAPDGNDRPTQLAYAYLNRALLLTEDKSHAVADKIKRKQLRAVTFNNMGCYYERRNKPLKSLELLDLALRLELEVKLVEDPSATHLNLCRVLSRLKRHEPALQHARCAIGEQ